MWQDRCSLKVSDFKRFLNSHKAQQLSELFISPTRSKLKINVVLLMPPLITNYIILSGRREKRSQFLT